MRKRIPRIKDGTLQVAWGYTRDQGEDMYYINGKGTSGSDSHLLYHVLGCERKRSFVLPGEPIYDKSLLDELKARGYDITTFRLSVKKLEGRDGK